MSDAALAPAPSRPTRGGSFVARLAAVTRRLAPFIRRHRHLLVLGTAGTLIVVACRLALPWPLRGVLELAFNRGSDVVALVPSAGDPAVWLGAAFVAIALSQGFGELVQRVSFARFSIGLVHDARAEALHRLERQDGLDQGEPGDLIARIVGDSARFKSGLKGVLIRMTQNGTFFVGVCVMLFVIDVLLGFVFLVGGALILTVAVLGASRVAKISRRLRKKEGRLAGHMHAVLAGRAGHSDFEVSERQAGAADAKTTKVEGLTIWLVHALLAATTCTVLLLGIDGVRSGRLEAGDLFTILFYLVLVHNPTVRLGRQAVRVGRVLASAERLVKVMDGPVERTPLRQPPVGQGAHPEAARPDRDDDLILTGDPRERR